MTSRKALMMRESERELPNSGLIFIPIIIAVIAPTAQEGGREGAKFKRHWCEKNCLPMPFFSATAAVTLFRLGDLTRSISLIGLIKISNLQVLGHIDLECRMFCSNNKSTGNFVLDKKRRRKGSEREIEIRRRRSNKNYELRLRRRRRGARWRFSNFYHFHLSLFLSLS